MVMRRRRAWSDARYAGSTLASGATLKNDLLTNLAAADTKTVSRLLIDLTFVPPVTNSAVDRTNTIDIGVGVVSREAFDLETLPDMDNLADYPQTGWLYVATKMVYKFAPDVSSGTTILPAHFMVDIRANRKVDRGVLFLSILNVGVNGTDNVDIWGRVRALCLT